MIVTLFHIIYTNIIGQLNVLFINKVDDTVTTQRTHVHQPVSHVHGPLEPELDVPRRVGPRLEKALRYGYCGTVRALDLLDVQSCPRRDCLLLYFPARHNRFFPGGGI